MRRLLLVVALALSVPAGAASVAGAAGQTLLGAVRALNLNSAGSDNSIGIGHAKYIVRRVVVTNASTSLAASSASLGVFTGAGATGTTVVTTATLTALSAATKFVDMTIAASADTLSASTLFVRNVAAHGSAATVDVYIYGEALPALTSADPLTITLPARFQTIQRSGAGAGTATISITGTMVDASGTGPFTVQARFNGGSYADIQSGVSFGVFSGSLAAQAAGQGYLDVRTVDATGYERVTSVPYVGVGDVFVVAGQSNANGRGTNLQTYSHATLRAVLYGNDYTWKDLVDPMASNVDQVDSVNSDSGARGSVWPLVATAVMAQTNVPVAFVPAALGGTAIAQWQPGANHFNRSTLYGSMAYRAQQAGAKAVLWWQGESDAQGNATAAAYNANLDTIANTLQADLGIKLMAAKLQNCGAISDAAEANVRQGVADAWADNANVLTGPDLSGISTDGGDGLHLFGNVVLQNAATAWAGAMQSAFGW